MTMCRLNHELAAVESISWPHAIANSFPRNDGLDSVLCPSEASTGQKR
jgi:hypothetical protein